MTTVALESRKQGDRRMPGVRGLQRHSGLLIAVAAFVALLIAITSIGAVQLSYYDLSSIATTGATLALAALGQTVVILSGGFDLSAGAVVSLVNVALASGHLPPGAPPMVVLLLGVSMGMAAGAFNGFFISVLRMQPIVVTLSTMFILQGITLLVMDKPGGAVPAGLADLLLGDAVPGLLPRPVLLLAVVLMLWIWLRRTRFGTAVYAIGSDFHAAHAAGVPTRRVQFLVYVIAGGLYGLSGVFISAQTGSGDPLIGAPMLLQVFAAVVVGGTLLGGGRGGLLGTVFGAYVLMMVVNILLVLNVSAYFSTIAEGGILMLAVLAGSLGPKAPLARNLRQLRLWLHARSAGLLISQRLTTLPAVRLATLDKPRKTLQPQASFLQRHAETLRFTVPSYVGFVLIVLVTQVVLGHSLTNWGYYNALLVLGSCLVVLALGQGAVILTGGLDLSLPWTIALTGILLAGTVKGSDSALVYALPMAIGIGAFIGLLNGAGVVMLGVSPIVVTLAMNGILQGVALIYSNGTPDGFASPLLRSFMTERVLGVTPVVLFMLLFAGGAVLLLGRTRFGRSVYAVGNGQRAAQLSGVRVGPTLIGVYILSGICSAIAAVLLTGLSGQASLGMGDDYLLPSIAVVLIGGTLIVGGRGHYMGMLGGVLLLTALQTLLSGTTLPYASRAILFGLVVLVVVIGLRERG
ncbi:ribose transport system permease protein [Variovorax sp. GrIS 2.14]|uniref:ABC transporter permease n=1 Tax=Variovorax sp. GrIS 2.14 TaxID=3071709 RepID=UPI0038F7F5F8